MDGTPFASLSYFVTPPVVGEATDARFLLDTRSVRRCFTDRSPRSVGCVPNGETFTGRRMIFG